MLLAIVAVLMVMLLASFAHIKELETRVKRMEKAMRTFELGYHADHYSHHRRLDRLEGKPEDTREPEPIQIFDFPD